MNAFRNYFPHFFTLFFGKIGQFKAFFGEIRDFFPFFVKSTFFAHSCVKPAFFAHFCGKTVFLKRTCCQIWPFQQNCEKICARKVLNLPLPLRKASRARNSSSCPGSRISPEWREWSISRLFGLSRYASKILWVNAGSIGPAFSSVSLSSLESRFFFRLNLPLLAFFWRRLMFSSSFSCCDSGSTRGCLRWSLII